MDRSKINIAFIDVTCIIFTGLSGILQKNGKCYRLQFYPNFEMFLQGLSTFDPLLVIINPSIIQNNMKVFLQTRNRSSIKWVGAQYSLYEREVLSVLDGIIQITDSFEVITNTIETLIYSPDNLSDEKEHLTAREIDILKLMLQSLSNKEIACKLNISVNTVKTHRQKLFTKTGTCKPLELLNYAISNKIIEQTV